MRENIIIGILIVVIIVTAGFIFAPNPSTQTEELPQIVQTAPESTEKVEAEDLVVGEGAEATEGSTVVVHYLGTLEDGTKFESSYDSGTPYETQIGTGAVIQGWDQGIPGMKVGGKRKLTIPASLAYGEMGQGNIPPNSTLIFEIELLEVK